MSRGRAKSLAPRPTVACLVLILALAGCDAAPGAVAPEEATADVPSAAHLPTPALVGADLSSLTADPFVLALITDGTAPGFRTVAEDVLRGVEVGDLAGSARQLAALDRGGSPDTDFKRAVRLDVLHLTLAEAERRLTPPTETPR